MPQTTEGTLLVIGAVFFLIGILGGGFEISAIKVPSVTNFARIASLGLGAIFMAVALYRTMLPPAGVIVGAQVTNTPVPIPATSTPAPSATNTPAPTATALLPLPTTTTLPPTLPPTVVNTPPALGLVTINNVTVDHNFTKFAQVGMLIHVSFSADGLKNSKGRVMAYFFDQSGAKLISHDSKDVSADQLLKYQAADGQLIAWEYYTPVYDSAVFNDLQLFLPYSAIELPAGDHALKFYVQIIDLQSARQALAVSPDILFDISRK